MRLRPPPFQRLAVAGRRALAARAAGRAAGRRPGVAALGGAAFRAMAKGRQRWMAVDGGGWQWILRFPGFFFQENLQETLYLMVKMKVSNVDFFHEAT